MATDPAAANTPSTSKVEIPDQPPRGSPPSATAANKVHFRVKVDHLGHLMIECTRAAEKTETGVRGLPSLIHNGWMLKPKSFYVDPLLRHVELDGTRFPSTAEGAAQLQELLNHTYAPDIAAAGDNPVEIKENPAAATGFDIRFVIHRAGARFEVKGHLCQEHLDVLQDPARCELLRHGTVVRLTPPYLIIRHRRADGSEEKIPELPDVQYRHLTALQLQQILNHPSIRQMSGGTKAQNESASGESPAELLELRLARNPQNKLFLWLECVTTQGIQGKAFTHHNVADLQHAGVFQPPFDVVLSLDNRTLSILNKETRQENRIAIEMNCSDDQLKEVSQLLSGLLKPASPKTPTRPSITTSAPSIEPVPAPVDHAVGAHSSSRSSNSATDFKPLTSLTEGAAVAPCESANVKQEPAPKCLPSSSVPGENAEPSSQAPVPLQQSGIKTEPTVSVQSPLDPTIMALFSDHDSAHIHIEIFRALTESLDVPIQDVHLSLPRVFEDRRFEILSFSHPEVSSVMDLRDPDFAGFYLSHVNEKRIPLDYAWYGKRLEWGPERVLVQANASGDPDEFKGTALLGMAVNENSQFVFVVTSAFKQWVKPREKQFFEAGAHFASVEEVAAEPKKYPLLWPVAAGQ